MRRSEEMMSYYSAKTKVSDCEVSRIQRKNK
jgi:hypothetical protein